MTRGLALVAALSAALAGCHCGGTEPGGAAPAAPPPGTQAPAATQVPAPVASAHCTLPRRSLRRPAGPRIVALGDVHGDLDATRAALRLGGAIDEEDRWIGGELIVVQTGDVLDRGDGERAILDLFDRLVAEAAAAGGAFIPLNGNHELMNAAGDLRYVTPGGFASFADVPEGAPKLDGVPEVALGRALAFRVGGLEARRLAQRSIAVIVGDTVFVHGGILPSYAEVLDEVDHAIRCWLAGEGGKEPPLAVVDPSGPLWSRHYASSPEPCDVLDEALSILGVRRMVVGHTVEPGGIRSGCDGRIWRIDVGMARHYGGPIEVLEIAGDRVRPIRTRR